MQNLLKRMPINNAVLVKVVYMIPCIKLVLITEEYIEIFLLNQDNVSLWMHTSTIAIPQEDISIVIFIRIQPVYTKDRSAHELCAQSLKLFNQHPEWQYVHDTDTRRFIRLDPERNYRSNEFSAFVSSKGYQLERSPSRDKHAGGVAERPVGVIVAKTNVAMLSPDNPVPQIYWDLAMTYACDTASYNFSKVPNRNVPI